MDTIKAFHNNELTMHITIRGTIEEPLFRASDIGAVFGLTNIHATIKDFDNTEKVINSIYTPGGQQEVTFLTESGLYEIMFRSRKPIAKKFKKWVCEVIKEIRINYKYSLEQQIEDSKQQLKLKDQQREKVIVDNFNGKSIVYIGYADKEKNIGKAGYTDFTENRLNQHKKTYDEDFTYEYVYESPYATEIERRMKNHPLLRPRMIEKEYKGKNRVELFQFDTSFTIEKMNKIVLEIKKEVETEEYDKDKNSEIDRLKLELIEKDKIIKELKKMPNYTNPKDNYVYIETNPAIQGQGDLKGYRISSSEEEIKDSKINFTYKTIHAMNIIDLVKILLKPYNKQIDDWTCIEYYKIKQILDFCILIYDHYQVDTDIEKLVHFIGKYNSTRLTHSNKARITIEKDTYQKFINDETVLDPTQKVTCGMLCDQFYDWYKKEFNFDNDIDLSHIKSLQGNWNVSFRDELMKMIENETKIVYESGSINVIDKAKGLNFTKCAGFRGIGLKNHKIVRYYQKEIYEKYVKEFIVVTNGQKDKVSRKEILDHFKEWAVVNGIFNPRSFGKIYAATFIVEIIEAIEYITGLKLDPMKTKQRNMGIFIGMTHRNF